MFINDTLKSCLDANNDTLSESVCYFLNSLDETFSTCTVMCSNIFITKKNKKIKIKIKIQKY